MKVFVTKFCLTRGILEKEVEKTKTDYMVKEYGICPKCFFKPYWHETKEIAIKHAEGIRVKRIASLKKQIQKLEKLEF